MLSAGRGRRASVISILLLLRGGVPQGAEAHGADLVALLVAEDEERGDEHPRPQTGLLELRELFDGLRAADEVSGDDRSVIVLFAVDGDDAGEAAVAEDVIGGIDGTG